MAQIAVDLDSTLYDFEIPAREAFFKLAEERGDKSYFKGTYDPWTQWRSPADAMGQEIWLEAIAMCHDNDVIRSQTPFAGSVETCRALIDEGHELLYISNRAPESTEATIDWLHDWGFLRGSRDYTSRHFPETKEPDVLCLMEDKKPYLSECQYLIDDRPKTVVDFIYDYDWQTKHGPKRRAFVKAYPYNQNLTDIPHLYLAPTWAGLNYYLVKKGVLSKPAAIPTLKV